MPKEYNSKQKKYRKQLNAKDIFHSNLHTSYSMCHCCTSKVVNSGENFTMGTCFLFSSPIVVMKFVNNNRNSAGITAHLSRPARPQFRELTNFNSSDIS